MHAKLIKMVAVGVVVLWCQMSFAALKQLSLYESRVNWNDGKTQMNLLASASIPKWDNSVINSMFNIYQHPEDYQLAKYSDENRYNILFINAHWGPIDNPFVNYPRPAKVIAFLDNKPEAYSVVPLVFNNSDGNFYVFTTASNKPLLLNDWISTLISKEGFQREVSFTICNGYANLPNHACAEATYQDEVKYAIATTPTMNAYLNTQHAESAVRELDEDWRIKAYPFKQYNSAQINADKPETILNASISWENRKVRDSLLATAISWPSYQIILDNFEKLRDLRYYQDTKMPNFRRRITWLYPNDGCWTRASAVIRDLFGAMNDTTIHHFSRPSKVFVFGNLCANTTNDPKGYVAWWYHTAPIVRDAQSGIAYVLDPSISTTLPLTMEQWVAAISKTSGACGRAKVKIKVSSFNVCNGFGATPQNSCLDSTSTHATEAQHALKQLAYEILERSRQVELGRNADAVLGDNPPWR